MTEQRPRVDTITDNDLDQLLAVQAHLADAVAEMTGLSVSVVLDEARQAAAPEQPDGPEPLELPRDAVQALHDLTAQLLGTQPSEALRLSEQRLEQVLADRERERHALTVKMRENEQLRSELAEAQRERDLAIAHDQQPYPTAWAYEQACKALEQHRQRGDKAEADLAKARQRIGELTTALDQAHDGNSGLWRAHAESVTQAGGHQAIAEQAKADRDQALAVGTALKTALTELAHQARYTPAAVECVHGITDRWRHNGVSSLAQYADTLLAALNDPEPT